jgi:hypothetical protein
MKKHHWHVFWHEKLFEKHPQPHCQTAIKDGAEISSKVNSSCEACSLCTNGPTKQ